MAFAPGTRSNGRPKGSKNHVQTPDEILARAQLKAALAAAALAAAIPPAPPTSLEVITAIPPAPPTSPEVIPSDDLSFGDLEPRKVASPPVIARKRPLPAPAATKPKVESPPVALPLKPEISTPTVIPDLTPKPSLPKTPRVKKPALAVDAKTDQQRRFLWITHNR